MGKLTTHSKAGLFLIEMIFSLLILAAACAVCIQIFAAAHSDRSSARELNHIQELTSTAGEILEGCDGEPETILSLLPGGVQDKNVLHYYYDKSWQSCGQTDMVYRMTLTLIPGIKEKSAALSFWNAAGDELYSITIRFPRLSLGKEAAS